MSVSKDNEQKLKITQKLLERTDGIGMQGIYIHADTGVEQIVIPDHLRNKDSVVLQVGRFMPVPIPDLRVDAAGVYGTLSFGGFPFTCFIPWDAIYALVDGSGMGGVWTEYMPESVHRDYKGEAEVKRLPIQKNRLREVYDKPAKVLSMADFRNKRARGVS